MEKDTANKNNEVTRFLDGLDHPLRAEIEQLRLIILNAVNGLTENVKWNGPNYCHEGDDRITIKIHPPKQVQLIFHRGTKKVTQPKEKIVNDRSGLLVWKGNDRAFASFKSMDDIERHKASLYRIAKDWINATR